MIKYPIGIVKNYKHNVRNWKCLSDKNDLNYYNAHNSGFDNGSHAGKETKPANHDISCLASTSVTWPVWPAPERKNGFTLHPSPLPPPPDHLVSLLSLSLSLFTHTHTNTLTQTHTHTHNPFLASSKSSSPRSLPPGRCVAGAGRKWAGAPARPGRSYHLRSPSSTVISPGPTTTTADFLSALKSLLSTLGWFADFSRAGRAGTREKAARLAGPAGPGPPGEIRLSTRGQS